MRRALVTVSVALCVLLGLLTGGTASLAYWTASAQTSTALTPATIGIAAFPPGPPMMLTGAAGTAYTAVDFMNTGQAVLAQLTVTTALVMPFPSPSAGFSLTASHSLVPMGTPCETAATWQGLDTPITTTTPIAIGANARLCIRLTHAGADSSMNGLQAMLSSIATGRFGTTSWQTAPATSSTFAMISGAPTREPSVIPQAVCTKSGDFLAYISYSGAPAGTYGYTVGSPDAATVHGSTDAVGLSSPGFPISYSNFDTSGPQSFFLVNVETRQVVAQAVVVNNNWGSVSCGAFS